MVEMTALILEDSPTQAHIIGRLIQAQGWQTLPCDTPRGAVDSLRTMQVQALFLDVFVGPQNILSMLPRFRQLAPGASLVVMTAGSKLESLERTLASARAAGADHVLQKPFTETQVKDIIKGLVADGQGNARRRHVLVVDDSAPVRSLSKSILEGAGYRVSVSATMEDAFKSVNIAHVDLVLSDIFMPGMGGLNGMRHIQEVWPKVKMIAMSAGVETFVSEEDALSAARALGAHAQIRKPFTAETLLEVASLLLDQDSLAA